MQGHTEAAIENQVEEGKKLQAMQRNKPLQLITETSNILTNRPAQELYQHAIRLVQGLWDDPILEKIIARETKIADLEGLEGLFYLLPTINFFEFVKVPLHR